jgi:Flp pilus assembly protein TadG
MKRLKKNERGAALLETAITVPIILVVCVGIFEFGRAYETWQVLTNAAREGARLSVIQGSKDDDVKTRIKNYATAGGVIVADAEISITHGVALTGTDTASKIQIDHPYDFMVLNPVIKLVAANSRTGERINMRSTAIMRDEK